MGIRAVSHLEITLGSGSLYSEKSGYAEKTQHRLTFFSDRKNDGEFMLTEITADEDTNRLMVFQTRNYSDTNRREILFSGYPVDTELRAKILDICPELQDGLIPEHLIPTITGIRKVLTAIES